MATDDSQPGDIVPGLDLDIEAPDAYCLLAGLFVLHLGSEMAYAREPSLIWGVASVYVFGSALMLIIAGVSTIDVRKHGRALAGAAFLAMMVALGVTYLMIHGSAINTDALGFMNKAGAAVLERKSPYTVSMVSQGEFPTPMVGGGHVTQFGYPFGAALFIAPFRAIASDGARIAVLVATAIAGGILIGSAPHELAPLGLFSLFIGDFITWGVQDLTDPIWVAPLLGAIWLWPWSRVGRDSLRWSAVVFGVAMAMKQHPWFCAPFLLLWVVQERGWRSGIAYTGIVATTFFVIHLPAFYLAPEAAAIGLLTNLWNTGGTLVHLGVGLSALTLSGAFPVAKGAHTILMAAAGVGGLVIYWTQFERYRWVAWLAWGPVLFFSYRSLANYFVTLAPVAVMLLVAQHRHSMATEVRDAASA